MSYKTRAELIQQVAFNLDVIAQGQSVPEDVTTKLDALVDPVLEELSSLDIYYVGDPGRLGPSGGSIDSGAFLQLANCVAAAAGPEFNLAADAKLTALDQQARARLVTMTAPPRTNRTLKLDPGTVTRRSWWWNFTSGY